MLELLTMAVLVVTVVILLLILRGSLAISRRVLAGRRNPPADPPEWPFVALILPCKGAESGLEEHLRAHLEHDYPRYEILFTVADADDPAVEVIRRLMARYPNIPTRLVVAPRQPHCVEKTSNQLAALKEVHPEVTVLAFADSDGNPINRQWLRELVRPTLEGNVATGYRWYLPENNVARLQGAFDAAWAGFHIAFHTVWGGAMAVKREIFERLNVPDLWTRAPTDDLVLARAAWKGGVPVVFTPGAMSLSGPHRRLWNFLMWVRRQALLVKLPTPGVYYGGMFIGSLYFLSYSACIALLFFPGPILGITLPVVGLGTLFLLTMVRAWARYHMARTLLPGHEAEVDRTLRWSYYFFVPLADLIMFPIYMSVLFQRAIRWRGVTYVWTGDRVRREGAEPWQEE
jgi:hypothetical protein